jgi:Family of unknown function (DUF6328)
VGTGSAISPPLPALTGVPTRPGGTTVAGVAPSEKKPDQPNPVSGRMETEQERLDRNYNELLQELRVAQTGTQILFAFLLTVSFTQLMHEADSFSHYLLAIAILACAAATALMIAPVAFHRQVFHRRLKGQLVTTASVLAQGGLVLLLVALLATCLLALDSVLSRRVAVWLTAGTGVWFLAFWYLLPVTVLRRHGADQAPADEGGERSGNVSSNR